VQAVEHLTGDLVAAPPIVVSDLLARLVYRGTCGAFAELAAYSWIARCNMCFTPQVQLRSGLVLGRDGSTLDGVTHSGLYFDIKAFGFHTNLVNRLRKRIQEFFQDEQVLISESWDLSLESLESMFASINAIAEELRSRRFFRYDQMEIRLQPMRRVTVTSRVVQPYKLAQENSLFVFSDAQQFTIDAPFAIIFVIHPWITGGESYGNVFGEDTILTRSLARRAFFQYSADTSPLNSICSRVVPNTTLADASRQLSAICFVNAWPRNESDEPLRHRAPTWIYLNPRAKYPVPFDFVDLARSQNEHGTHMDDFAYDDY
jgi:hypothetical protein